MLITKLADHYRTIIASFAAFNLIFIASLYISSINKFYSCLPPKKKVQWGMKCVSFIHALLIVTLSIPIFYIQELWDDPLFGYNYYAGEVFAIAAGYFLWDTILSIYNYKESGLAMVIHGIACFLVYFLVFKPYLNFYGPVFLMFEISTIFLDIHWFCDKTG